MPITSRENQHGAPGKRDLGALGRRTPHHGGTGRAAAQSELRLELLHGARSLKGQTRLQLFGRRQLGTGERGLAFPRVQLRLHVVRRALLGWSASTWFIIP
jgi:hypothetical protein